MQCSPEAVDVGRGGSNKRQGTVAVQPNKKIRVLVVGQVTPHPT